MVRACRVCSARAWSCAGRSAASVGVAVARTRQWRSPVRHAFAVQFFAVQQSAKRTYSTVLYRISRADLAVCVPRRLVGAEAALAATAATVGTLHSIALIDMGRKPYSERSKELKNIRTMETLVPSNLLHVDDDDNQFNPEPEINHTASSSSDSRTNYDAIAAAAACSLELSTTAAACLPQSRSKAAQVGAPMMGNSGQRATPEQRASPQQTDQWDIVLTKVGHKLGCNMSLLLEVAILCSEAMLNLLRKVHRASLASPQLCDDASPQL